MSDSSQLLVAVDAAEGQVARLASELRQWLIDDGIVEAPRSGSGGRGERLLPGPRCAGAVQGSPPAAAWSLDPNAVDLLVGRQVFDGGANEVEVRCASCGQTFGAEAAWLEAVETWAAGDDHARYACERCGVSAPLVEWRGPWPWAFGNLGVEFWNWPPLSEPFIRRLAEKVAGRVVLVRRRL